MVGALESLGRDPRRVTVGCGDRAIGSGGKFCFGIAKFRSPYRAMRSRSDAGGVSRDRYARVSLS
ncbi:hypothetical protein [Oxynema aestuarii]|uniref:hypothetical protein n=1 Tax=Oxynema aestuarii TaxID=2874213 RepID=UPI001B304D76|nr:hypothetical protein [Oxynema aestuarii]